MRLAILYAIVISIFAHACQLPAKPIRQLQLYAARDVCRELGLSLTSLGRSNSEDDLTIAEGLSFGFAADQALNPTQARKLIVSTTERLLTDLNSAECLAPHLENFPLTVQNLTVTIRSKIPDQGTAPTIYFASVAFIKGIVRFNTRSTAVRHRYIDTKFETWSEAVQIASEPESMNGTGPLRTHS